MRASLMAVSTASDPDDVSITLAPGIGARSASTSASSSAGGLVKRSKQWKASSVRSWDATASATSWRPCPIWQNQRLAVEVTYDRYWSSYFFVNDTATTER